MRTLRLVAPLAALATAIPAAVSAQSVVALQQNVSLVSRLGGKCLDVEGGSTANGTRVVGYPCSGSTNQQFWFNRDGRINHRGKCLVVQGGQGRAGDQLVLWDCNGGANEQWRLSNGRLVGQNGLCADLKGGGWGNVPFMNQPVILWNCHGGENQTWYWGVRVPQSRVANARTIPSGQQSLVTPISGLAGVVSAGGANVVSAGGANVISAGGGNVISAGGGNVIAVGGGN